METAKFVVGIIHIILSIIVIALILLQSGKQAGLPGAVGGAADSFFGKNKGKTMDAIFARFTKIFAVCFLLTSLFLAYGDAVVNKATSTPADNSTSIELPLEEVTDVEVENIEAVEGTEEATEEVADDAAAAEATETIENTEEAPADATAPAAE